MYDLQKLRKDANEACNMAFDARETFKAEPVNWADLGCTDAQYILHADGRESHAVIIEEASPEAWAFRLFIADELAIQGYKNIDVITEW